MEKIGMDFVLNQYESGVDSYTAFTLEVGLWESEKYVFEKYLKFTDQILDLGCGTGRTTFPLFDLGYTNIQGMDYTPDMITAAETINESRKNKINFQTGDARNLPFVKHTFEIVIFSFNGLMSIPQLEDRTKALGEIYRVLKPGGYFIFTTHDRDMESGFLDFWVAEKAKWNAGTQNPQLHQYGDIIAPSKNESREIFIHIPSKNEVAGWVADLGFKLKETFYRSEKFEESEAVKNKSGECRFWIVEK